MMLWRTSFLPSPSSVVRYVLLSPFFPYSIMTVLTARLLPFYPVYGMLEAQETAAVEISPVRDARDFEATYWAIELLRVDSELEPFIEDVPNVVACTDLSAKLLLHRLLNHDAVTIRLGYRIQCLLVTCTQCELVPTTVQKRAITCLSAIWSFTMMSLPALPVTTTSAAYRSWETLHFDEQTLKYINLVQSGIPSVSDYSVSALTVVSKNLLDMYIDQILRLETEIGGFVVAHRSRVQEIASAA
ncbi:hypothetical protein DFS33DRAFT_490285 [Desarmillaria ectypa]|nr:hypothetical protein DFS33DRAFT_490285 [Desarmillaria ectypa]